MTKIKIGYLIPEFPGQTHNFFWRERQALQELGVDTSLISTRRPPQGIISPAWAQEAQKKTVYLFPPSFLDIFYALIIVLAAGPKGWFNCIGIIANAPDMSPIEKVRLMSLIFIATKLVRISKSQGWRHVHVHSCADAANIAMFAATLGDLTYSLTLHNPLSVYGPNQEQKWHHAKFGIVITQKIYNEVTKSLPNDLPQHLEIAPMGVDCSVFKRAIPYESYDGKGNFYIFSCGRLNFCKGHANLIEAIHILRKRGVNAKLEIAGEDEQGGSGYRRDLERLIQDLNLGDAITLLGAVSEEVVKASLEKAHVFVLASLGEPLGVATMEAMAMSVPVVVTNAGGVTELVNDGIDGILVPPRNPDAIAAAVLKILQDKDLAVHLSRASRDKIVQSFTHQRSAKTIASAVRGENGKNGVLELFSACEP
jgi:glycosyltransferase involved in cell wall biosynthesis